MAKRNKRSRQKARTPTIQNSGYSNGGASHESNILKATIRENIPQNQT